MFKHQNREQNLSQGKAILERELRRLGLTNLDIDRLAADFDYHSTDDFYVNIGTGDLSLGHVINTISDNLKKERDLLEVKPSQPGKEYRENEVAVLGLKGILTTFAKCCHPAPGDQIVGYITRGRGATIHRQDCPNILRMKDHERIVKVTWGEPRVPSRWTFKSKPMTARD